MLGIKPTTLWWWISVWLFGSIRSNGIAVFLCFFVFFVVWRWKHSSVRCWCWRVCTELSGLQHRMSETWLSIKLTVHTPLTLTHVCKLSVRSERRESSPAVFSSLSGSFSESQTEWRKTTRCHFGADSGFLVSAPSLTADGENEQSVVSSLSAKGPLRKAANPAMFTGDWS